MSEIDKIHDILTDLLCSAMEYVPYEEPKIGEWCYEVTSTKEQNRDCRIGVLKEALSDGEYITVTVGGREIHWHNSQFKKIPSDWIRTTKKGHPRKQDYSQYATCDLSILTDREKMAMQGKLDGLNYKDLADKMGVSVGTVGTTLHRAICKLSGVGTYEQRNKDKINERQRQKRKEWTPERLERQNEYHKKYVTEHAERIQEYNREYYAKNKDKILENQKKYRKRN